MMRQDRFTEQAQQVLANSQEIVRQKRNSQWGVAHVLAALVTLNGGLAEQVLQKLNVDMNRLRQRVGKQVADLPTLAYDVVQIYTTPEVVRMLEVANSEAERLKDEYVGVEHLLIAIADNEESGSTRLLAEFGGEQGGHLSGPPGHPGEATRDQPDCREPLPIAREVLHRPD
ncbi:Clp protease N-terminal domain-containing protein [Candidatus Amarobacter glycogenicus]|uniref:Clp protease N-terminal domain-containing protein n=1 Tax=Candidatus Amarobacter glycogenicus TaxID=3140699 RepID=UPI0031CC787A